MNSLVLAFLPALALGAFNSANQNDVVNGGACKAMTVLFARGTKELGNMGSVAGPPFVSAIGAMMGGDVAVQGIEYPADVSGFLAGGDKGGSALMAQMVSHVRGNVLIQIWSWLVIRGQLVHNAADMLSAQDAAFVSSAVIFGDPNNGDPVGKVSAADTMVVCHTGDLICAGQTVILAPHLTYGRDGADAAQFVIGNMKTPGAATEAAKTKAAKKATRAIKFVS